MVSNMSLVKPPDVMATYPTTDNNLEAFHSKFEAAVPRSSLPLFLGVAMAYHFVENCRNHAKMIESGYRKPNRKRGAQHNKKRGAKDDLQKDEWIKPPPEKARALRRGK